jgi:hypothetical protein
MLINSIDFAIFLPIVFLLYWYVFAQPVRHPAYLAAQSSIPTPQRSTISGVRSFPPGRTSPPS